MTRSGLALLAVVASLALVGCTGPSRPDGIVLITLDTTRADRLGCYGYEHAATPRLDRFAGEGVRFAEAQSSVPVTLPSHATMFTGRYPPDHGVRYNGMFKLGDEAVTVAEVLRDAGWETVGMPASYPLTASTNIGQGFAVYRDMFSEPGGDELSKEEERKANGTSDLGIEWLRGRDRDRPFFLWLHYFDPHAPYEPPFPYSSKFRDQPYDGEIAFTDEQVGRVLDALDELGLAEDTLVVIAGDHGEGLFQHGEAMHANLAYQSTLHVPLMARGPGVARGRVEREPVALADLAATVLDYAGVEAPPMSGRSLRAALEGGEVERRTIYLEAIAGSLVYAWSPLEGVRRGPMKYIDSSRPELYDLEQDPDETTNLYETMPSVAADLAADLVDLRARWAADGDEAETAAVPLDPDELAALASLGYVGGTVSEERRDGPHPPDLVHLESAILHAGDLSRAGLYDLALREFEIVLREDPTNRHALYNGSIAATRSGKTERGVELGAEVVERYPEFRPGWVTYGDALVAAGRLDEAVEVFAEGLADFPDETALRYRLAVGLLATDRCDEAVEIARGAATDDETAYFRIVIAECSARAGDRETALAELRAAVDAGYERGDVLWEEPSLAALRALPGFEEIAGPLRPEPDEEEDRGRVPQGAGS